MASNSNIEDIWASMNDDYTRNLPTKTKSASHDIKMEIKVKKTHKKGKEEVVDTILTTASHNATKKKKKPVAKTSVLDQDSDDDEPHKPLQKELQSITYADFMTQFARDITALSEDDATVRKRALLRLHQAITQDFTFSSAKEYNACFHDLAKPLLKRVQDNVEKCRELSLKLIVFFFEHAQDFVPILGYYLPTLLQRNPKQIGYDEDMKMFIFDVEAHQAYKRGKAIDRQDKAFNTTSSMHISFVEPSEEIRFHLVQSLATLIRRVQALDCMPILHPYFEDIIYVLQIAVHDSNPETKVLTCDTLAVLAAVSDYELGFKYYAVALIRSLMVQLRHKHAKVRIAAIHAIQYVMIVPDRNKRKASGSEAIMDLVGFREDNVLPIAAFYKAEVQFNYLAALVSDPNPLVRERLAMLLTVLLTEIDDRYDHQQRLLPYILDLLTDELDTTATLALTCLQRCGQLYEEEHREELLTKRQYNVDGDTRINLDKPLPRPFTALGRPSIGLRLFVRGNSKRFLTALIQELTNWKSDIRLKSANLLKMIVVLCEEHLTMETHSLLPSLIKALRFARDDADKALLQYLLDAYELLGRYLLPEIYLFYVLPRLRGDSDVVAFELDNESRLTVLLFLQALLSGSKSSQIIPFIDDIVSIVTDSMLLNYVDSLKLATAVVEILRVLCVGTMQDASQNMVEAYYLSTGRLSSLHVTIRKMFRFVLTIASLYTTELQEKCLEVMAILATVETTSSTAAQVQDDNSGQRGRADLQRLFATHSPTIFQDIISKEYDVDVYRTMPPLPNTVRTAHSNSSHNSYESTYTEHQVLQRLLLNPYYSIQRDPRLMTALISFCRRVLTQDIAELDGHLQYEEQLFHAMGQLLTLAFQPLCLTQFAAPSKAAAEYFHALTASSTSVQKENKLLLTGLQTLNAAEITSMRQEGISVHMNTILEVFVYNHHWGKSAVLNQVRLQLLALLSNQWNDNENTDSTDDTTTSYPLSQEVVLRAELSRLADTVLSASLLPTVPQPSRLLAVQLFGGFLQQWKALHHMTKTKKFKAQQNGEVTVEDIIHIKLVAQSILSALLVAINDSDDDVRTAIIQTLLEAVPMVLSEEEIAVIQANTHLFTNKGYVLNMEVIKEQSFSDLVKKLLLQVFLELALPSNVHNGSEEEIAYFDATLRSLAVLDPALFETLVRQEYSTVQAGSEVNQQRKEADFVSALLNHVDILLALP